jgi:hypothetical protein
MTDVKKRPRILQYSVVTLPSGFFANVVQLNRKSQNRRGAFVAIEGTSP